VDKADSRDEWVEEDGAPFLFDQDSLPAGGIKEIRGEGGHTGQSHFL